MGLIFAIESDKPDIKFFSEVENIVRDIIENEIPSLHLWGKNQNSIPGVKKLQDSIKKNTGISTRIITNQGIPLSVKPIYPTKNATVLKSILKGGTNVTIKSFEELPEGTVNIETFKVTGYYSNHEQPIFINFTSLVQEMSMSSGEIAACILGEVGYIFAIASNISETEEKIHILRSLEKTVTTAKETSEISNELRTEFSKAGIELTDDEIKSLNTGSRRVAAVATLKSMLRSGKKNSESRTKGSKSRQAIVDSYIRSADASDYFDSAKVKMVSCMTSGMQASNITLYDIMLTMLYVLACFYFFCFFITLAFYSPVFFLIVLAVSVIIASSSPQNQYASMTNHKDIFNMLKMGGVSNEQLNTFSNQVEINKMTQSNPMISRISARFTSFFNSANREITEEIADEVIKEINPSDTKKRGTGRFW